MQVIPSLIFANPINLFYVASLFVKGAFDDMETQAYHVRIFAKVSYVVGACFTPSFVLHLITIIWLIAYHIPMWFTLAVDHVGARLYEPLLTKEDWSKSHR